MKLLITTICLSLFSSFANAEVKSMAKIMKKLEAMQIQNIPELLLHNMKLQPIKKSHFRVTEVEKGSALEKVGIRTGDVIDLGNNPGKTLELTSEITALTADFDPNMHVQKARPIKLSLEEVDEMKNPKPTGVIVDRSGPGSAYEKINLRPGDRVIEYDGKKIYSPSDALEFYNRAKDNRVSRLVIERNGRQETIKVK